MKQRTCNLKVVSLVAILGLVAATVGAQAQDNSTNGPIRLARFSYVSGNIAWRNSGSGQWTQASNNLPLQQGAQIWANNGGRAEIMFDDGSTVRIGNGGIIELQTLYSDDQGEFTEIKLDQGTMTVHSRVQGSIYQVDTPFASIKTDSDSEFRVDVGNQGDLRVLAGSADVSNQSGAVTLHSGDAVDLENGNSAFNVHGFNNGGDWYQFNKQLDAIDYDQNYGGYLPSNVAIEARDLNHYGHWRFAAGYGQVWCPDEDSSWRPYYHGHWVYCDPFGWTWVGDEPWGWAPYHYGSWIHESWGWGWCPGPVNQYWSPAVVQFCNSNNNIAWAPLCPEEVRYPSYINIGFRSGNWAINFSIGGVAVYHPTNFGYCEPHIFNAYACNRAWGHSHHFENFNQYYGRPDHFAFVPHNSRYGYVQVQSGRFGSLGRYQAVNGNGYNAFRHGHSVSVNQAFSGPVTVRPTLASYSIGKAFGAQAPRNVLTRQVFRAPVSHSIALQSEVFGGRTISTNSRSLRNHEISPNENVRSRGTFNSLRDKSSNKASRNSRASNSREPSGFSKNGEPNSVWEARNSFGLGHLNSTRGNFGRQNQSPQRSSQASRNPFDRGNSTRGNFGHQNQSPQRSSQGSRNPFDRGNSTRGNFGHQNQSPQRSSQGSRNPFDRGNSTRGKFGHQNQSPQRSNQGNRNQSTQRSNGRRNSNGRHNQDSRGNKGGFGR